MFASRDDGDLIGWEATGADSRGHKADRA